MTSRQINRRAGARRPLGRQLRRTAVVLCVGGSALGVAGVAQAYLTGTGGGAAGASTHGAQNLTATATTTTLLWPGIAGVDVTLKVTNPNSKPVTVTGISTAGAVTGCTAPAVTLAAKPADLGFVVGAGTTASVVLHQALAMGTTASGDCQGASISIPLSLSGKTS